MVRRYTVIKEQLSFLTSTLNIPERVKPNIRVKCHTVPKQIITPVQDRDIDGARKIGYRFLAQLYGGGEESLGPWKTGSALLQAGVKFDGLCRFAKLKFPQDFAKKAGVPCGIGQTVV